MALDTYQRITAKFSYRDGGKGRFDGSYSRNFNSVSLTSTSMSKGAVFLDLPGLDGQRIGTYLMNEIVQWVQQWPETTVNSIELLAGQAHGDNKIGEDISLNVARRLVVFTQRAGGQSQFSPYLMPFFDPQSSTGSVQQYVLANLTCDLGVQALAQIANMSPRNFSRVFSREAKVSPAEFVELARLDAARRLLEHDRNPLKTIALNCGFRDGQHMRDVFRRRLGVSPQQYRSSFGMVNAARQNG